MNRVDLGLLCLKDRSPAVVDEQVNVPDAEGQTGQKDKVDLQQIRHLETNCRGGLLEAKGTKSKIPDDYEAFAQFEANKRTAKTRQLFR